MHVFAIINAKQPAAHTYTPYRALATLPARDQVQTSSCMRLTSVPPATTASALADLTTGGLCGEQMSTVNAIVVPVIIVSWE